MRGAMKRVKTKHVGVYFRNVARIGGTGIEKCFYITFKKDRVMHEEKIGRQYADRMTEGKAARIRSDRIEGRRKSRQELREEAKAKDQRWTVSKIWETYKEQRTVNKALKVDDGRFELYLKDKFGSKEPREILQLDVDRLRLSMLKEKSPATVKATLALLKRIANFGQGKGCVLGLDSRYPCRRFQATKPKTSTRSRCRRLSRQSRPTTTSEQGISC